MAEIGYYNYYNIQGRPAYDTPKNWYQQMVDRYESDELKSLGEGLNPYSERNLKIHALDEKLASMGESLRARFSDYDDADKYLCKKYFGTERIGYTKKYSDPEKYAMYINDLNVVMYGTTRGGHGVQFQDPRLEFSEESWAEYDAIEEKSKHDSISNQMAHLLENNKIELDSNTSLLISINPYSKNVQIEGMEDLNMKLALIGALESGSNAKNLLHYGINVSNTDNDALTKYRAYSSLKEYTGLELDKLIQKDDGFYTSEGKSVLDILKEGIENTKSVRAEFRNTAFNYVKDLLDSVLQEGWNNMPDLDIKLGYSKEQGFFSLGKTYEA